MYRNDSVRLFPRLRDVELTKPGSAIYGFDAMSSIIAKMVKAATVDVLILARVYH
jgi:hypothetical protein